MTLAVSKAVEDGAGAVACACTGNTSASAAAYAARAGIDCLVILPAGNVALGKLAQAIRHGATVVAVDGSFDDALELVRKVTAERPIVLVNSINPYRILGQQSARLGGGRRAGGGPGGPRPPGGQRRQHHRLLDGLRASPSGGPGHVGLPGGRGRPAGARGTGCRTRRRWPPPSGSASPASWDGAIAARDESGGRIEAVTDEEILAAYRLLAAEEGVFAEPASAASVAGILKFRDQLPDGTVVCTLTGHGLKDPGTAMSDVRLPEPDRPDGGGARRPPGLVAGSAGAGTGCRPLLPPPNGLQCPIVRALGPAFSQRNPSHRGA